MAHVVTAFLRHRGDVLLVRRSDEVGTYRGTWGGVSGYVENDAGDALDSDDGKRSPSAVTDARRELAEEVGVLDATLVRAGDPIEVDDGEGAFTVHPFLFEVGGDDRPEPALNEELTAAEWVQPTEIRARDAVPKLWKAYEAVAPTVEDVRTDETHGSAYVSIRALEVLRDRAAVAAGVGAAAGGGAGRDGTDTDDWEEVAAVARDLRDARPSMTALATRVNRVMCEADRTAESVLSRTERAVDDAVGADDAAAANGADLLRDEGVGTVLTVSRSGTVLDALLAARPAVVVAESRTAREGVGVAETLADAGLDATLTTDAAAAFVTAPDVGPDADSDADIDVDAPETPDALLLGADTVFPDGSVANKVGSRALALAAARDGVPCYVVAARDKVAPAADGEGRTGSALAQEFGDDAALYEGDRDFDGDLALWNPVFDRVPADTVSGVVTEAGVLDAADVAAVAAEHRDLAAWDGS